MIKLTKPVEIFLEKKGSENAFLFKQSGRPTPTPIFEQFQLLSILQILLQHCDKQSVAAQLDKVLEWGS